MSEERIAWLKERRTGIGGSDVAAILGLPAFKKTAYDIWLDKTGRADLETEESDAMHFGNVLEDVVADEFTRVTGLKCRRANNMFRHPEHNELLANLDRKVEGRKAVLECKTTSAWMADKWGETGTDQIPENYLTQVTHYMNVTGYEEAFLGVLIGGNQFRHYHIPYNKDLGELLKARCVEFWQNNVKADNPPPPANLADIEKLYAFGDKSLICTATQEIAEIVEELKDTKAKGKELEDKQAGLKQRICAYMKDAGTMLGPDGNKLAAWTSVTTKKFDAKAFKADKPDLHKQYTMESGYRRFLLK